MIQAAQETAQRAQTAPPDPFRRLDRQPTADERASAAEAARLQAIYQRNVEHGYQEWKPLLDGGAR